jgi:hypothetical protein
LNYCHAHPSSDEASHLAVLTSPLGGKQAGDPLLSSSGMLVGHTINGVDHGSEVLTPLETGLLIFLLLPTRRALQDFLRLAIPVAFGVSVADLNVKESGPPSFPKNHAPQHPHRLHRPTLHLRSSAPHSDPSHKRFQVWRRSVRPSRPSSTSVPTLHIRHHSTVPQKNPSCS